MQERGHAMGREGRQQMDCYQPVTWVGNCSCLHWRLLETARASVVAISYQLPASEVSRIFVTKSPLAIGGGQLLEGSPVSSLGRAEVSAEGIHHGQLCSGSLP